jgi:hypothetical protein
MNNTAKIESITRYMKRKEEEIGIQTKHILKIGEDKVGTAYMKDYYNNLDLWDEANNQRRALIVLMSSSPVPRA